jgi:hypothetical protein
MHCYNCQYFNQCSYKNQLIPMPYYYSSGHGRIVPGMKESPLEMSVFRDEPPNYIPPEPPGATMDKDQIIKVIESCKSGWVYIWTEMDTEFWDKIISHDRDSVTTDKHGKILYDRIRKIKCHEAMKKTQIPQENQEPSEEEEEEVVIAKRFYDNNCRNCYYYHVCPVKMQIPHSPYYRAAR